jgi:hypothetical protein
MFGGASKPAPSFNFGGSSSTPSNDKPFSFGGSQPQAQEKPFGFGGASSQNTGGSSSMFSPEQPTKQASAPSFNFGGGGSQPSSQTNMFGGNSNSQRYVVENTAHIQFFLLVLDLPSEVTTKAPLLLEEICSATPVVVRHPLQPSTLEVLVLRTLLKIQASILVGTQASLHR